MRHLSAIVGILSRVVDHGRYDFTVRSRVADSYMPPVPLRGVRAALADQVAILDVPQLGAVDGPAANVVVVDQ